MKLYSILPSKFKISSLVIAFGIIGFSTTALFAQTNPSLQEDAEFSQKWEAKLNHAISPNHSHAGRNEKSTRSCLSLVILEGINNKNRLTPRLQKVLKTYDERPTLSFSASSAHFRFHYDKTGDDAVPSTDSNNNNIPDYVEFMAAEFENVYEKEIENLAFVAPPSDGEEGGGNGSYDVYISNIDAGTYGYVSPETTIGDNPNSSATETQASTSWMAMRNNYEDFGVQEDAIKVTAAHEFFHAIQMGYNANSPSAFAFEGSASWMEEEVYPRIDDNFQYLESIFGSPDVAVNYDFTDDNDPDFNDFSTQWYGSWIFFQYVGENYGKAVIKTFWENLRAKTELEALNSALLTKNITVATAFEDFFVANIVLSASSSAKPYIYARAADYITFLKQNIDSETVKLEGTINFTGQNIVWNSNSNGNKRLMRFSADYLQLTTQEEEIKLEITPADPASEIGIQFVSLQSNGLVKVVKNFPNAGQGAKIEVKNINPTDKMYIIVYRLGKINENFTSKQYTMKISRLSQVTGIDDNLGATNYFKIASNPVSDNLNFVYQLENPKIENYKVTITDVLGRTMIENNAINQSISTSKWAKGTYFITLLDNQKQIAVRKIVIQ